MTRASDWLIVLGIVLMGWSAFQFWGLNGVIFYVGALLAVGGAFAELGG